MNGETETAEPGQSKPAAVAAQFLLDFKRPACAKIAAPREVMMAAAGLLGRHLGAIRVGYSRWRATACT